MFTDANIDRIIDSAIKDISRRVAKMEVSRISETEELPAANSWTFFTKTKGDYNLTVVLSTEVDVVKAIASNMKRSGEAGETESFAYVQEFFNIWCGHVISTMNQNWKLDAHFDFPSLVQGDFEYAGEGPVRFHRRYYYGSSHGLMKLETLCS